MQNISLTTDLGLKDNYSAILKAKIISKSSDVRLIDISNEVNPFDILSAANLVKNSYQHFPKGTIHVILVHNYYDFKAELLLFTFDEHYFVCPDNGLPGLMFEGIKANHCQVIQLDKDRSTMLIFDKVAHAIACVVNQLSEEIGPKALHIQEKMWVQPVVTKNEIRATIIEIDRFENVITNVDKATFDRIGQGRTFELFYKHDDPLDRISKNYSDVQIGDPVCLFNEAGLLEISINMGKAASLFGLRKNETIQIHFSE